MIEDYLPEPLRIVGVGVIAAIDYGFWIFGMEYVAVRKNPGDRERAQGFQKKIYLYSWSVAEVSSWVLINITAYGLGIKIGIWENWFLLVAVFVIGWLLRYRKYLYCRFLKKEVKL